MANTFKFGNKNWAVKKDYVLAYNDENDNFKPLPFDFTRDSIATYVDSDGLIKTAQKGIARIDYTDNTDGHLLLEPSRTNLFPYSEDFSQSDWLKTNLTVTSGFTSPSGDNNAYEVNMISATANLYENFSVSAERSYTLTFYAKKGTATDVTYRVYDVTNLSDIIAETSYYSQLSNDWVRIEIPFTTPVGCTQINAFIVRSSTNFGTVFVYGAQLEEASYATSYIPTEGSSVTRSFEDADENVLTNFSGNSYTVLFDMDFSDADSDNNTILGTIWYTDSASSFTFRNFSGDLRIYNNKDSAYPTAAVSSSSNKWVMRVDGTSYKLFGKGSIALTATLSTARTIYKIETVGNSANKIKNWKIYNEALSNAECEALID